ncbi:MAG: sodium:proton antiporter [Deltaproteobacteria bacterium]|jgi:Na+/H+ antiporter NhaD/arsenite permease-like protein|nr:sodium:proton antiporter [Deltaproteobacteria bacterium]
MGNFMKQKPLFLAAVVTASLLRPCLALAAAGHPTIPGAELSGIWAVPFVCMLLSIAVMPLALPDIWHHHFGKISLFWGLAFFIPCLFTYGSSVALYELLHTMFLEYIPFLILLLALFTVAGGVRFTGALVGTPAVNAGILLAGTLFASWMGTTGAAMLFIRPLLRANRHRKYKVHSVIFFIFLVANIGGSLTPLGDPPLFLGFLKGVSFFWTTSHLFLMTALLSLALLSVYFILDTVFFAKEGRPTPPVTKNDEKFGFEGKINLLLLAGVVSAVLMSGTWQPAARPITIYGIELEWQNMARDAILLLIAGLSLKLTSRECRDKNDFSWSPIQEVAKLFLGIFLTIIPVIAILRAGTSGALATLVNLVSKDGQPVNVMYFWLSGGLSSFLDNAPTYLVFFNTAGGDALQLMGPMAQTLVAISAGSVFMGANTYIGNAPNFMVRSIAEEQGVAMPSFFGYMLWSGGILIPSFIILSWLVF